MLPFHELNLGKRLKFILAISKIINKLKTMYMKKYWVWEKVHSVFFDNYKYIILIMNKINGAREARACIVLVF